MKRFVHSFWTKPCENDDEKLRNYILYFATSLAWLKKNNFPIVLHTDSKGKELFKNLPYDEIYTTLDNIPEDINPKFYAYGKFLAMQQEELGNVHIDGDVFIKSKELAENILNFKSDLIVQSLEDKYYINKWYRKYDFNGCKDIVEQYVPLSTTSAYNCGVIGINNQELKDKYFKAYLDLVSKLKDYQFTNPRSIPDLVCEQLLLYHLYQNAQTLLEYGTIQEMNRKNYLHIVSPAKMSKDYIEAVERMLQTLNLNIYNICQNI